MTERNSGAAGARGRCRREQGLPAPLRRTAVGACSIGALLLAALQVATLQAQPAQSVQSQPAAAPSAPQGLPPSAAGRERPAEEPTQGPAGSPGATAIPARAAAPVSSGAAAAPSTATPASSSAAADPSTAAVVPQPSAAALSAPPVPPEPLHRLAWDPAWPHFRPIGYVLTAASIAGALAVTFLIDYPDEPRWSGGILFDDAARRALRARSLSVRSAIRTASDITLAASLIQTALVDGALLPLLDHNPGLAAQLTLINAQAFSVNILVTTLLFKAVARARPLVADCERDPNFDPLCSSGAYASFPSSHTSMTFTAAGLTCVHHAYLPLYGGPWDLAACAESIAVATATGLFRVIGDRHYVTDVLFGAAIGFSIGYIYPWLFHYRYGRLDPAPAAASVGVIPVPPYGLGLLGQF
jgi:membrane-associated phospholipid phosphatase